MKKEQNGVNTEPANSRIKLNFFVETAIKTQVIHIPILNPINLNLRLSCFSLKRVFFREGMSAMISELKIVFERNVKTVVSM